MQDILTLLLAVNLLTRYVPEALHSVLVAQLVTERVDTVVHLG